MHIPLLRGIALFLVTTACFAGAPDASLKADLQKFADEARPGTLGIIVMDPLSGAQVSVNADHSYLMMSVFKAPIAAAVLSRVDAGTLRLTQTVHLTPADVVDGSAVPSVGARLKHGPLDVSIADLLKAAVSESDNTAVDALLRQIGGGPVVTRYLEYHRVHGMRIDFGEGETSRRFRDLKPGQRLPTNETSAQLDARYARGYTEVLTSQVNSTTLDAAATFLRRLQAGQLLSGVSTRRLLAMMQAQVIPARIRAGLPAGFAYANKTGTSGIIQGRMAALNDMGIITAPDGRQMIVAVFLRDAPTTMEKATPVFVKIGKRVCEDM